MSNAIYLKIDGVKGTSTDSKHKDWIELESYSFGGTQASTFEYGTGSASGKVGFHDFSFAAKVGKESPDVFGFMCCGEHVPKVQLEVMKSAGKGGAMCFIKIILEKCFISSFTMGDNHGSPEPHGNYSINFGKATFSYIPQKDDGSPDAAVTKGWDAKENRSAG